MSSTRNTKLTQRRSARLAAGVAISALLALGTFAGAAQARVDHDGDRGYQQNWNNSYYNAPPVVYGGYYGNGYGYYAPPPVVYGSGVGISLPGISIGIR